MFKNFLSLWHVLFVPLITGYPFEYCPSMLAIAQQSLSRIRPLVCPAALEYKKRGANSVHLPITCNVHPRQTFYEAS